MPDEQIPTIETPQTEPLVKSPQRPVNPTVQLTGVVVAAILAFALLVWAQGVRTAAVRREAFGRGVDGIAAALAIPVLETGSRVNTNRDARLQAILNSIQRTSKLESIVVTDATGNVIASTDTSQQGQTVVEMSKAKSPAVQMERDGVIESTTSISTDGGDMIGALRVRVRL